MTTTTKGPVRVLIADDDREAVMVLSILLRSEGYDVRLAQGGKEALAQAAEFHPHVALCPTAAAFASPRSSRAV
jgi:CheY-like chemotaxis protein